MNINKLKEMKKELRIFKRKLSNYKKIMQLTNWLYNHGVKMKMIYNMDSRTYEKTEKIFEEFKRVLNDLTIILEK